MQTLGTMSWMVKVTLIQRGNQIRILEMSPSRRTRIRLHSQARPPNAALMILISSILMMILNPQVCPMPLASLSKIFERSTQVLSVSELNDLRLLFPRLSLLGCASICWRTSSVFYSLKVHETSSRPLQAKLIYLWNLSAFHVRLIFPCEVSPMINLSRYTRCEEPDVKWISRASFTDACC